MRHQQATGARRSSQIRNLTLAAAMLTIGAALPAHAHVFLVPNQVPSGFQKLSFRVLHGCDDLPTTRVTVKIPDGLVLPKPRVKPGWEIATVSTTYPEPIETPDRTFTEGFKEITWQGGSLPSAYLDDMEIALVIPDRPGAKFRFTVVQECEGASEPLEWAPEVTVAGAAGGGPASLLPYLPVIIAGLALIVATAALVLTINRGK